MNNWLSDQALAYAVSLVDLQGEDSSIKRSENPLDHEEHVSRALKFIGDNVPNEIQCDKTINQRHKDDEEASKLRFEGLKSLSSEKKIKDLEKAIEFFTKSIAYSTPNGSEIAVSYSTRSSILGEMNCLEECLNDIQRASEHSCPDYLRVWLCYQRGQIYAKLGEDSYIATKYWLDKIPKKEFSRRQIEEKVKNYSALLYKREEEPVVPTLKSSNSKIPYVSDAIDVEHYAGSCGKSVTATRDIDVGEVLIVDKPYSSFSHEKFFYTNCFHCTSSFWNGIVCEGCVQAVYCSNDCKTIAWERYHQFECPILDVILQYDFSMEKARCARILFQMLQEANGLLELKKRIERFYGCNFHNAKLQDKWFKNQSLESILTLKTNVDKVPHEKLVQASSTALCILYHTATRTNFFGTHYERQEMSDKNIALSMSQNPDITFVGGLLFKLALIVQFNGFTWNEVIPGDTRKHQRGVLISPLACSLKLSCNPNVVAQCLGKTYVFHSIYPIRKGEEIEMPYGKSWLIDPKNVRIQYLKELQVTCRCAACKNNWPVVQYLESYEKQVKSPQMLGKIKETLVSFYQLDKTIYNGNIQDRDRTLKDLIRMMTTVYKGVNRPCLELAHIWNSIIVFYHVTSNVAKMKSLH